MSDLAVQSPPKASASAGFLAGRYGSIVVTCMVILYIGLSNPAFVSQGELNILMVTSAPLALLAAGVTVMLVVAEFDLSFAANMTFGASVCAKMLSQGGHPSFLEAAVATLALCTLVGVVNGIMVTRLNMSAFITTLAMSGVLTGLAFVVAGFNQTTIPASFGAWTSNTWLGMPEIFILAVVVLVVVWFGLERTPWGRNSYAVGGNLEAALLRGVPIKNVKFWAFVVMGFLTGVTAVTLLANLGTIEVSQFPANYLLDGLACVFLGTAVLRPGQVHVGGTAVGVVLVTVLISGMTFTNISLEYQSLVIGLVLVLAVCFSRFAGHERWTHLQKRSVPPDSPSDNASVGVAGSA